MFLRFRVHCSVARLSSHDRGKLPKSPGLGVGVWFSYLVVRKCYGSMCFQKRAH